MSKFIDLTGQRFGMYLVVSRAGNIGSQTAWNCLCDCGNTRIVQGNNLKSGTSSSCGCRKIKHGQKGTRLYDIWRGMKGRCYKPNHKYYARYGGRGITVCEEWKNSSKAFFEWAMANGYEEHLTLDRIDNDKGYYPDNCQWSTKTEQNNNRCSNTIIEINGKTQTLAQWATETGISYQTIYKRYQRGKRGENLIADAREQKLRHSITVND